MGSESPWGSPLSGSGNMLFWTCRQADRQTNGPLATACPLSVRYASKRSVLCSRAKRLATNGFPMQVFPDPPHVASLHEPGPHSAPNTSMEPRPHLLQGDTILQLVSDRATLHLLPMCPVTQVSHRKPSALPLNSGLPPCFASITCQAHSLQLTTLPEPELPHQVGTTWQCLFYQSQEQEVWFIPVPAAGHSADDT